MKMALAVKRIQRGFTLIEMVMVIVIGSIMAVGITQFMGQTVQGFADAGNRQQLATIGWIVAERMSRELRTALPNSLRVNATNSCIEYIPTVSGSHYTIAPILSAASTMNVVRLRNYNLGANTDHRVAVYPNSPAGIYPPTTTGALSSATLSQVNVVAGDEYQLVLTANHQFPADSPEHRFFVTEDPVTYCIAGSTITRYRNYGIVATIASSPMNPEVIVNQVNAGFFDYSPASLVRNAVVTLHFTIKDTGTNEQQVVDQEVQIRNVP